MNGQVSTFGVPPGPQKRFLIGNFYEFHHNFLQFIVELCKFGSLAQIHLGPSAVLVVNEPELIYDVLAANANCYRKPISGKSLVEPFFGNGLTVSEGEYWKRHRKLMQPAFHSSPISSFADTMVKYATDTAREAKAQSESGQSYAVDKAMTSYSLRVMIKVLFNLDIMTDSHDIINLICEVLEEFEFYPRALIPRWLPTTHNRRQKKVIAQLDAELYRFIDDRRKRSGEKGDILSMLLSAQDKNNAFLTN